MLPVTAETNPGAWISFIFSDFPPHTKCPHTQRKEEAGSGLFAFHASQTGSPVAAGVRVRCQEGAVVSCGGGVCFLLSGISVSNNDRERGRWSPQCLAVLRFGEQWLLLGPRGQLLCKIPDGSTEIFDAGKVGKQEKSSTSSCHLVDTPANL